MAYTLNIAEAAEDVIRQAFLWYEEQKGILGNTFESCGEHKGKSAKKSNTLRLYSCFF